MARNTTTTATPVTQSERERLIEAIIAGSRQPSKPLPTFDQVVVAASNAVNKSLEPMASIGASFTGAWEGAKQRYRMERNFREQERLGRERELAAYYADRLARLI